MNQIKSYLINNNLEKVKAKQEFIQKFCNDEKELRKILMRKIEFELYGDSLVIGLEDCRWINPVRSVRIFEALF